MSDPPLLHVGLDADALRRLISRQPVILRASTGERVALVAGEIDFQWLAEFATKAVREMIYGEGTP
jgi:hypothetical protein